MNNTVYRGLMKEIKDIYMAIGHSFMTQVKDELVKTSRQAIQEFYEQYHLDGDLRRTPTYFRDLDFIDNAFIPYTHFNGRTFYGGITLTPERIKDHFHDAPSEVYMTTIGDYTNTERNNEDYGGFRGPAGYGVFSRGTGTIPPRFYYDGYTSPLAVMIAKRDELRENSDKILEKAINEAKRTVKLNYLSWN